ncbi:MAG: MFS transporter [Gammaproteobacteria bacterium]|nr:MFS transporter [Gammaproteobacteria bacterium]
MPSSQQGKPLRRLASFYFFNFIILGLFLPFWPLYLQAKGFSPVEIGELLAVLLATRVISPNFWGWVADKRNQPVQIIRLTSALALLSFIWVYVADTFWQMALMLAAMGWFWNATLPQFEAVTLRYLGQDHDEYGRLRAWGSIGFVVAVLLCGEILERICYIQMPALVWPSLLLIAIAAWWVPISDADHDQSSKRDLWQVLKQPAVIGLFVAVCLMQVSHAVYYTFYSLWMEQHGYSGAAIGGLWSLGVIAEILVFWVTGRLLRRWSAETLLLFSLVITAVRWQITAWLPETLTAVLFAQTLHAITYGVYHAAAIQLVHRYFKGGLDARGQGLYSSVSFGLGGAIGSYAMGHAWEGVGAEATFAIASAIALLGLGLAWLGFRRASL